MPRLAPLLALVAALAAAAPARAEVGSYLLFDVATGEVLAAHEASHPWYPASVTKLMTVYVTLAAVRDGTLAMTSPVKISPQAHMQPPSSMGFAVGTVMTVDAALRLLMTKSANDVAVALAEAVGGTQAAFVVRMNATAARLDMTTTTYDNPHGLPNELQVTSARDLALLTMALARDFPNHADLFAMTGVRLGQDEIANHNSLIRRFPGADGMKTGFICAAGFNVAASATQGGVRLAAVVLGGLTAQERDERAAELLAKGFLARANGGVVALDGFGDPADRLTLSPVAGTRPPLGSVAALAAGDGAPADLRDAVCGPRRPATRYDDGTVAAAEDVVAERQAHLEQARRDAERAAKRALVLAMPRAVPVALPPPPPAVMPQRRSADESLAPPEWRVGALAPPRRPAAPRRFADATLVPTRWAGSPSRLPPRRAVSAGAVRSVAAAPSAAGARFGADAELTPHGVAARISAGTETTRSVSTARSAGSADAAGPGAAVGNAAAAPSAAITPQPDVKASLAAGGDPAQSVPAAPAVEAPTLLVATAEGSVATNSNSAAGAADPASAVTTTGQADAIVPPGWTPSPALPQRNPLAVAGLRPTTEETTLRPALPLTYLAPAVPMVPVVVALGGADATRPAPLSGAIVGGGAAPVPRSRPSGRAAVAASSPPMAPRAVVVEARPTELGLTDRRPAGT